MLFLNKNNASSKTAALAVWLLRSQTGKGFGKIKHKPNKMDQKMKWKYGTVSKVSAYSADTDGPVFSF
jgi:hypothetical protein